MYLKLKSQMSLIIFDASAFEENVASSGKHSLALDVCRINNSNLAVPWIRFL